MVDNEVLEILDRCADAAYNCGGVTVSKDEMMEIHSLVCRQQSEIIKQKNKNSKLRNERNRLKAEIDRLKLEMSYMKSPNMIGDSHEMGAW